MSENIDMLIKQRLAFKRMNFDMVFWESGIHGLRFMVLKALKMTKQECAENWFLTRAAVTHGGWCRTGNQATGVSLVVLAGPGPTVKISPESGKVKLNLWPCFKEFPW